MTALSMRSSIRFEIRDFLRLAIPLASAQVAQAGTGFVDTVMMGWLGDKTLAAGGLATMTFFALLATAMGIVSGISPMVAEAYGSRNPQQIGRINTQGLWLSLLIALPVMGLLTLMGPVMLHLGQSAATVTLAKTYLDVILWGFFPALGFTVLRSVVAGLALARPVMVIVLAATLFNALGNYVLAFGKLGFPAMGLAGLALASSFAHWGMFLSLLIYMLQQRQLSQLGLFRSIQRLEPIIFQKLVGLGIPLGVAAALEVGLFTAVTYLMGILGTEVLAAHQIVFQTIFLIFMVPLAMSYAATVRVGLWSGQRDSQGVRRAAYVSVGLGAILMTIAAIALLLFPHWVIGLYLDLRQPENAAVEALAIPMLRVAALAQILDGVQKTANGALQGLQDTRVPALLSFLGFWGVGLTSGYLLGFVFQLDGVGLWIGQSIGVAFSAIAFIWRFQHLMTRKQLFLE